MPFDLPSLSDFRDLMVALGKALFPGLNFGSPDSYHGREATWMSAAATQLHFHADSAQRDSHPLTAGDGKPINDWGKTVGVERKEATGARKAAAGRMRGDAAAFAIPGTQLRHPPTGLLFQIANAATVTIPGVFGVDPASFIDVDISGVDTGSQTRLKAGESLVFLSTPPNLEDEIKLVKDLDEDGFDFEQFGSYRGRVLRTFSQTPSGGSPADFVSWTEASLASVHKGYSFPNRNGRGTIDVAGFYAGSGSARALTSLDRASVLAYVKTQAPFQVSGEGGGLRVLTTVPDPQIVEILLTTTGIPAYAFDWSGSDTVGSYTAATRTLVFANPLPASLRAGHRIVPVGTLAGSGVGSQDGREYRIEAITGASTVILDAATPIDLDTDDLIYPGGPLVTPVRKAIVAHMNGEIVYAGRGGVPVPESDATDANGQSVIGLDILADGMGPANPGSKYGSWAGGIVLATLFGICRYKAGVRNLTIVSPVADYEPLDDPLPTNDQIHYVTPQAVIIRSA